MLLIAGLILRPDSTHAAAAGDPVAPAFQPAGATPVSIAQHPQDVTLRGSTNNADYGFTTNNATFTVVANEQRPTRYQWRFNGVLLPGRTNTSLTISNVTLANDGNYDVVVSDSVSAVMSNPGRLTVLLSPMFLLVPSSLSVPSNGTFTASVRVRGNPPPFTYTWREGSTNRASNVVNSASDSFISGPITRSGPWSVVVRNSANPGGILSLFNVTMLSDTDQDGLPDGWETTYFPLSGADPDADADGDTMSNMAEYIAGTDPTNALSSLHFSSLSVTAGGVQLQLLAVADRSYRIESTPSPDLDIWMVMADIPARPTTRIETVQDSGPGSSSRFYRVVTPSSFGPSAPYPVYSVHTVGYVNVLVSTESNLLSVPLEASDQTIASLIPEPPDGTEVRKAGSSPNWYDAALGGWLDPNMRLEPGEYFELFNPGAPFFQTFVGIVPKRPVILQQPRGLAAVDGGDAVFFVSVLGAEPLHIQWQRNGVDIPSATGSQLWLSNLQFSDAGSYTVVVTNNYGAVTSLVATLTVGTNALEIVNVSLSDGSFQFSFDSQAGVGYRVEYKNSLEDPAWTPLGAAVVANGSLMTITDSVSSPSRFYRLAQPGFGYSRNIVGYMNVEFPPGCTRLGNPLDADDNRLSALIPIPPEGTRVFKDAQENYYFGGWDYPDMLLSPGEEFELCNDSDALFVSTFLGDVTRAPIIWRQPTNTTVNGGSSAVLCVEALSSLGHSYEWRFNGTPIPDAFSKCLVLDSVQSADAGNYSVRVFNSFGAVTSAVATLTVLDARPPTILTSPTNQTVTVGSQATFAVVAGGTSPLSYQWFFQGTHLAGATNAVLTLANVQTNQSGPYSAIVTNLYGAATSAVAVLMVAATCIDPPNGLSAWWPWDGDTFDIVGTDHGALRNGAGYATGAAGQALAFDGVDDYVEVPDSPALHSDRQITLVGWFNVASFRDFRNLFWKGNLPDHTCNREYALWIHSSGQLHFTSVSRAGGCQVVLNTTSGVVGLGQWYFFAATINADLQKMQIYLNGDLAAEGPYPAAGMIDSSGPLLLGKEFFAESYDRAPMHGRVDEVAIFKRALLPQEIVALYAAGSLGMCRAGVGSAPTIARHPISQRTIEGEAVNVTVEVTGSAPLTFQWLKDRQLIPGATNPSLSFASVELADTGIYEVRVTNSLGAVTSDPALLKVSPRVLPPSILVQPGSTNVTVGADFTLRVVADGTSPLTYAWSKGGVALSDGPRLVGSTGALLSVTGATLSDSGSYRVTVANAAGVAQSVSISVTVTQAVCCSGLSIADVVVTEGGENQTATFALQLSPSNPQPVSVRFTTADGSALGTNDFVATNGLVTLAPGQTNASIEISVVADNGFELDETFYVRLFQPSNTVILRGEALGVIRNDDPPPDLRVTAVRIPTDAIAGQTLLGSWTTTNQGPGLVQGEWVDHVWLSRDGTTNGAWFVDAYPITRTLGSGKAVARTNNIPIPAHLVGSNYLVVHVNATRSIGEEDYANNVTRSVLPIVISRPPGPNLRVASVLGPVSVFAGQKTVVQWAITNAGNGSTLDAGWEDAVYLSADAVLDGSDRFLGSTANASFLEIGATYANNFEVAIPPRIQGFYHYIVRADWRIQVNEGGFESDNLGVSPVRPIILPPTADLVISAVSPGFLEFFSGQRYPVNWTVANAGGGTTDESFWCDRVYLSTNATRGPGDVVLCETCHTGALTSNQSYNASCEVALPVGVSGSNAFYFIVETDYRNDAWEYVFENNNVRATGPFSILLTPPPDLEVQTVLVPTSGHAGFEISLSYRVQNNGSTETPNLAWNDGVYLSPDNVFNPGTDRWLRTLPHRGQLQAGQGYNVNEPVRLPIDSAGLRYLIVVADDQNTVFETNNLNNWRASATAIQIQELADLQAGDPSLPTVAFAGLTFQADYRVTNSGPSATLASAWNDTFFLSADTAWNPAVNPRLTAVRHSGALNIGDTYQRTVSLTAPIGLTGDYFLLVVADHDGEIPEGSEVNNQGFSATRVNLQLASNDLQVVRLDHPASARSGFTIPVSYTVTNHGAHRVPNREWQDRIYLSPDLTLDPANDLLLAAVPHYDSLGALGSYAKNLGVRIPDGLTGSYYVLVVVDSAGAVFEREETNNVLVSSTPIALTSVPPDLVLGPCRSPSNAIAGTSVLVEWAVRNSGPGPTSVESWSDEIILSPNPQAGDPGDRSLALVPRRGALDPGQAYSATQRVVIPGSTPAGTYYLLVHCDAARVVYERGVDGNNLCATQITVSRPKVDLVVTELMPPASAEAGQPASFSWTIQNTGDSPTGASSWVDRLYLSREPQLDTNAIGLGAHVHMRALGAGATDRVTLTVELPWEGGDYYVLVRADDGDLVPELSEENNDATSALPLQVAHSSPPDLTVSALSAQTDAISGQTLTVSWTVNNSGSRTTRSWYDAVFLSLDTTLDRETDLLLGYREHSGDLDLGAYSATHSFDLPVDLQGDYTLFVLADSRNQLFESNEGNNSARLFSPIRVRLPPPSDLLVTEASVSGASKVGEAVTISYTVANQSSHAVEGRWQDTVYLSADRQWDVTDVLVARLPIARTLPPWISYTQTFSATIPGILPGNYYAVVRADILNQIPEGDEGNNLGVSDAAHAVDMIELRIGEPRTNELAAGTEHFYKVCPPAGEVLAITLDGFAPVGFNELFTRVSQVPTRVEYDFGSPNPFAPDQQILVPNTTGACYYNLARGQQVPGGNVPYQIRADLMLFEIRSVSPGRIGDSGRVTLTLRGARFAVGAEVELVNALQRLRASRVFRVNETEVKARFVFTNAARGAYDVVIRNPDGATALAPNGVVIEAATGLLVQSGFDGDLSPRFGSPSELQAGVKNVGNVDVPYLVVQAKVQGRGGWSLRRPEETLPMGSPGAGYVEETAAGEVAAFLARDLAPGTALSFSLRIHRVQEPTLVSVAAVPRDEETFKQDLGRVMSELRTEVLTQQQVVFSPSFLEAAQDPVTWRARFADAMAQIGILDPGLSLLELNGGPDAGGDLDYGACQLCAWLTRGCALAEVLDWPGFRDCDLGCGTSCAAEPACSVVCAFGNCALHPVVLALSGVGAASLCESQCFREPAEPGCGQRLSTPNITLARICPQRPIDPNELVGPPGFGAPRFVGSQVPLRYTVLFENLPTATAHARRIRIQSAPGAGFDLRTVRLGEITLGQQRFELPEDASFYQVRVALGPESNRLLVEITAGIDVQAGEVFWSLTAIDPATGEPPESASLGLLPPNGTNHLGEGSVSYFIRPLDGLSTGVILTNRATIVFDHNEPLATNPVWNTLDARPPDTWVVALAPGSLSCDIALGLAGDDDAPGSRMQGHDVYVAVDNGPFQLWLGGTTLTSVTYAASPGHSYQFFSRGRDQAGNLEEPPTVPDVTLALPALPEMEPIPSQVARVGQSIVITNRLRHPNASTAGLTFALLAGPDGARINETNGVFQWTPTCAQGSTTNLVTVRASSGGAGSCLSSAHSFYIVVNECVEVALGQAIVTAGGRSTIGVHLLSTVELTNLCFVVIYPDGLFLNWRVRTNVPAVNAILVENGGRLEVCLAAVPGLALFGPSRPLELEFTARAGLPSAFVELLLTDVQGTQPDGRPVANEVGVPGRVVVIGSQPLLEARLGDQGDRELILYGNTNVLYTLQWKTNLATNAVWNFDRTLRPTDLRQVLQPRGDDRILYRAYE